MEATPADRAAKASYFANLLEQAERYDDVPECMDEVARLCRPQSVVQSRGLKREFFGDRSYDSDESGHQRCRGKPVGQVDSSCKPAEALHGPCERKQACRAAGAQNLVDAQVADAFYHLMKADSHARIARSRIRAGDDTVEFARSAYEAALTAVDSLPSTHPLRFEVALKRSVFHSEFPGDAEEGCRNAPMPLRCTTEQDSCSRSSQQPSTAVVAHRLCDLLLEFPDAGIGGVAWSTLENAYSEVYGDNLDMKQLGYASVSEALDSLLCTVLPNGRCGCKEQVQDGYVVVDPQVALTPLPGFAAAWPSLYGTLCEIVRGFGAQDDGDGDHGQGQRILLSQLRPLLEKWDDVGTNNALAGPARSLLLSQLSPVSQLSQSNLNETGLSFRDSTGQFRKLQKIGHVVKAVIQWREQKLQWRISTGKEPTAQDAVLAPRLELVFSKKLNNLVLKLVDVAGPLAANEAMEHARSHQIASADATGPMSTLGEKPRKNIAHVCDNPFKWTAQNQAHLTAMSTPDAHCDSSSAFVSKPWRRSSSRCPGEARGELGSGALQRTRSLSPRDRSSQSLRSTSACADSTSETRSRSEPPHYHLPASIFDDPFEPPPQVAYWPSMTSAVLPTLFNADTEFDTTKDVGRYVPEMAPVFERGRSLTKLLLSHDGVGPDQCAERGLEILKDDFENSAKQSWADSAETESVVSGHHLSMGTFSDVDAQELESAYSSVRFDLESPINKGVQPLRDSNCRPAASISTRSSSTGRGRSNTRASNAQARDDALSLEERTASPIGLRSKSEPPTQRMPPEVFDNPFEPPPELERWGPTSSDETSSMAAAFTQHTNSETHVLSSQSVLCKAGVVPTTTPIAQTPLLPVQGLDLPDGTRALLQGACIVLYGYQSTACPAQLMSLQ